MAEDETADRELTDAQKKIRSIGTYKDDDDDDDSLLFSEDYDYPYIADITGRAEHGNYGSDPRGLYDDALHNYRGARKGIKSIVWHEFGKPALAEFNQNYMKNLNGQPFDMDKYKEDRTALLKKFRWGNPDFEERVGDIRNRLKAGEKVAEGYNPKNLPKYFDLLDRFQGEGIPDIQDEGFKNAMTMMGYGGDIRQRNGKNLYYGVDPEGKFVRDANGGLEMYEDDGTMAGNSSYRAVPGNYADDYTYWDLNVPSRYQAKERLNPYYRYTPDFGDGLPEGLDKKISMNPLMSFNPHQTVADMKDVANYLRNAEAIKRGNATGERVGDARPAYEKMDDGRKRLSRMLSDIRGAYEPLEGTDPESWDNSTDPSMQEKIGEVKANLDKLLHSPAEGDSWQKYLRDYLGAYKYYNDDLMENLGKMSDQNLADKIRQGVSRYDGAPDLIKALAGGLAYESYPHRGMMDYYLDPDKQRAIYAKGLDPQLYTGAGVDISKMPKEDAAVINENKRAGPGQYQQRIIPSSAESSKYRELTKTMNAKEAQDKLAGLRGLTVFDEGNSNADRIVGILVNEYGMPLEEARTRVDKALAASKYASDVLGSTGMSKDQQTVAAGHDKGEVKEEEDKLRAEDERKAKLDNIRNLRDKYARLVKALNVQTDQLNELDAMLNDPAVTPTAEEIDAMIERVRQNVADLGQREINKDPEHIQEQKDKENKLAKLAQKKTGRREDKIMGTSYKIASDDEDKDFSQETVKKMESFEEMLKESEERNQQDIGYRQGIPVHSQIFKNTAYPVILGNDGRDWKILQAPAKKISDEGSVKKM